MLLMMMNLKSMKDVFLLFFSDQVSAPVSRWQKCSALPPVKLLQQNEWNDLTLLPISAPRPSHRPTLSPAGAEWWCEQGDRMTHVCLMTVFYFQMFHSAFPLQRDLNVRLSCVARTGAILRLWIRSALCSDVLHLGFVEVTTFLPASLQDEDHDGRKREEWECDLVAFCTVSKWSMLEDIFHVS